MSVHSKVKKGFWFVLLSGIGFLVYKVTGRSKLLKKQYDTSVVFNGKQLKYQGETFGGESIASIFSGLEIDFKGATLLDKVNTLVVYGEFSGISIKVPEEWNVEVVGVSKKSAISNKVDMYEIDQFDPKLVIQYNLKYSALEVKH
jgi:hypothetical protein